MIDWATPLNAVLAATGTLAVLVLTYFVDRTLRRRRARDAIEEAIITSVEVSKTPGEAASYVQMAVPEQMKTLGVDSSELHKRIEQRVSQSRSMVI